VSYEVGTELGRLREMIGDTGPDETFGDAYLNDLLTTHKNPNRAAAAVYQRLINDEDLLILKYDRGGQKNPERLTQLRENLLRQIEALARDGRMAEAPSDPSWVPEADNLEVGFMTDEDGVRVESGIDDILDDAETKMT